jgi:hypothetical protein
MAPRTCRTLRGLHEGTPKQRTAACLRGGRQTGQLPSGRLHVFLGSAFLRRFTHALKRQTACRICECPSVAASRKG